MSKITLILLVGLFAVALAYPTNHDVEVPIMRVVRAAVAQPGDMGGTYQGTYYPDGKGGYYTHSTYQGYGGKHEHGEYHGVYYPQGGHGYHG